MKRWFIGSLTVWYVAAGLGIAEAAAQLRQAHPRPAAASFACAGHQCGCRTAQQCQLRCCCFPKQARPPEAPRLSAHAEDCHGPLPDDAAPGTARLGPHLPPARISPHPTESVRRHRPGTPRLFVRHFADPPEKVPLRTA